MIVLLETWMEEKGWDKMRDKLRRGYIWKVQGIKRKSKKRWGECC